MSGDNLGVDQWRPDGLCGRPEHDPADWFPDKGGGAKARKVCAVCPVRRECLLEAIYEGEEHGIWGGAGEHTRRLLRGTLVLGERRFMIEVQDHFDRLDEFATTGRQPDGPAVTFGPGAQHGKASTYNRGCHCPACTEAKMESIRQWRLRKRQGLV